ncbi:MAG TPA: type II toxin-antitoxin system VapC family toxin [Solirubrobacteraceae bacterium]|nr:type II toxin-antitoxin system VapC family toxin [Solirubrobacteraceae bacterium]
MLIADAALVIELSLDRLGEQASSALGCEQLVAPCLLWSEVPSVLNELAFRGEISRELAGQALERFLEGRVHVAERRHAEMTRTAWRIAAELGWAKTYDAEYLAMARLLNTRVVTLDMRLRRGADRLGLVVTPVELIPGADPEPTSGSDQ